jgi:uncharacterized protein YjbI with pentapeptide repeats
MSTPKDFSHLDLNGRNFIEAKMFGANLTGADLRAAGLSQNRVLASQQVDRQTGSRTHAIISN